MVQRGNILGEEPTRTIRRVSGQAIGRQPEQATGHLAPHTRLEPPLDSVREPRRARSQERRAQPGAAGPTHPCGGRGVGQVHDLPYRGQAAQTRERCAGRCNGQYREEGTQQSQDGRVEERCLGCHTLTIRV